MNVNEVVSDFQFMGSRIAKFSIKTENSNPGKLKLNFDIDYDIKSINENNDIFVGFLTFTVNILGKSVDDSMPLLINLVIEGCFTAEKEKINKNTFINMVEMNGLITLSQISRSYLISATALSGISPAIKLPMVNVFSLIKNKRKDNKTESKC